MRLRRAPVPAPLRQTNFLSYFRRVEFQILEGAEIF